MPVENDTVCEWILSHKYELTDKIINNQNQQLSENYLQFRETGRLIDFEGVVLHLSYLASAIKSYSKPLFMHFLDWLSVFIQNIGLPFSYLKNIYQLIKEVLLQEIPFGAAILLDFLNDGEARLAVSIVVPVSFISEKELAPVYLQHLLQGKKNEARSLIMNAVQDGTEIRDLYLHVFEPVQKEIGRLWQLGKITVADEHYVTAVSQLVISELYQHIFVKTSQKKGVFVSACIQGELHEIGLRMVTDICELDGWDTRYLGANSPSQSIVQYLESNHADVLGISITLTPHIIHLEGLIQAVRKNSKLSKMKIIVGGLPFSIEPGLHKQVGADDCALDLISAVKTINQYWDKNCYE